MQTCFSNTDWPVTGLSCYIHDNQSVLLSRSIIATQLLCFSLFFYLSSVCKSLNHRDRTISTINSNQGSCLIPSWCRIQIQTSVQFLQFSLVLKNPFGLFSSLTCFPSVRPATGCWLQHVHDEVIHLVEHHKVNG